MYAIRSYYVLEDRLANFTGAANGEELRAEMELDAFELQRLHDHPGRITSYNVCYTKLLRPAPVSFMKSLRVHFMETSSPAPRTISRGLAMSILTQAYATQNRP